jgi:TolA-binding protein
MRFPILAFVLLAGTASGAIAQSNLPIERRIDRLEAELRAVQRRVFPQGSAQTIAPELRPPAPVSPGSEISGDALASLVERVDALEAQLRSITGQVEEQGHRTRQLETAVADLRGRLERLEQQSAPPASPAPASVNAPSPAAQPAPERPSGSGNAEADAEEAYNAGYRLWSAGNFAEAQRALNDAATRYPNSRWTSWMRNLLGRAYLDDDKPATAARIFLDNYQSNPRGERAADSLFFLGQALTRLNRRTEACRVYDELAQVYPNMRDYIRTRLPDARRAARCN